MSKHQDELAYIERVFYEYGKRYGLEAPYFDDKVNTAIKRINEDTFKQQRAFITDKSKRVAALTSRRAGKSNAVCRRLITTCLRNPNSFGLYFALTKKQARDLLWGELKRQNHYYGVNGVANETFLQLTLPNEAVISLLGADNKSEISKFRGYKTCVNVIDEASTFGPYLEEMVREIIEPSTLDLDGDIVMTGTPANHCSGMFFEITTGMKPGWKTHKWTLLDNPFLKDPKGWIKRQCDEFELSPDDAFYQREYLGKWVKSYDSQVYLIDRELNTYDGVLPDGHNWKYVLGIDLGFHDQTAFHIWAFAVTCNTIYEIDSYGIDQATVSDMAEEIIALQSQHGGFAKIVCDTGGLGRAIVEEFRTRYKLPVHAAEKKNKYDYIRLMNADFKRGRIKVFPDSKYLEQAELLQWDISGMKEDERFKNDSCDAALYPWRECLNWKDKKLDVIPEIGSSGYFERKEKEILDRQVKQYKRRKNGNRIGDIRRKIFNDRTGTE